MREYIAAIARENAADAAHILAAMDEVAATGTVAARHLRGDIWEVRATGGSRIFRILFATEDRYSQVLLALEGFTKKSQRTPSAAIDLAESRLRDWRARGARRDEAQGRPFMCEESAAIGGVSGYCYHWCYTDLSPKGSSHVCVEPSEP